MTQISPISDGLGIAIREARRHLRLSQAQASRRVDIHRNYWGMLERGEANPTLHTLTRVAHALSVPLPDLLAEAVAYAPRAGAIRAAGHR